ncbi:uncharacterized protein LOC106012991 [Aplysia californica]|uniref:Uncharacterized protein LOC106012991 n=1 Tax=Aplysia californica TaxID=6500 RepID=A0ABM1A8Q5_APLCA|nr:uncharacterized protein LOC106012991 [Aplysia californica]
MGIRAFVSAVLVAFIVGDIYRENRMGKPWASVVSKVQAPVQNFLRPAVWVPGLRNLHSHRETWTLPSDSHQNNLESVLGALMTVIKEDKSGSFWDVQKNDLQVARGFIRVFVYTRAEWLDIIELTFKGTEVQVWSFSSGFLPLFIPFACVLNVPLFWIPFLDNGLNKHRINKIVKAMDVSVDRH